MNMHRLISLCSAIVLLAGCAYQPSKEAVDKTYQEAAKEATQQQANIAAINRNHKLIKHVPGNWLGIKVKALAQEATLPPIFKERVTLSFPGRVNLRTIAERLTKVTGLVVTLKPDVFMPLSTFVGGTASASPAQPSTPPQSGFAASAIASSNVSDDMELNFVQVPLRDILNQIGSRFGINWTYQENDGIVFSRLTTRTLRVKANPGDTSLTASLGKGGSAASTGTGVSFTSNGQVTMNSNFSIWTGIQGVLDTIKSPAGKYSINQATGQITITDTKEVVDVAANYIEAENSVMTQQVAIRVEVLSVSAADNNELGVNWTGVFSKLTGASPDWVASLAAPSTLTSAQAGSLGLQILTPRDSANGTLGKLSGSQAVINALQGYARITNRQTFAAVTLNRQPAPLAKTSQLNYLQRTTPGGSAGVGGSTLPGLEPGLLTTGFLSSIVPTVLDNANVLLQFSIDSSELKSLGTVSTGQGPTLQTIQTPQVDAVQTVQRVALKSGATLVLTGFEREVMRYDQRGLTQHIGLGGSYSGQSVKESVVIILTPVIIDGA